MLTPGRVEPDARHAAVHELLLRDGLVADRRQLSLLLIMIIIIIVIIIVKVVVIIIRRRRIVIVVITIIIRPMRSTLIWSLQKKIISFDMLGKNVRNINRFRLIWTDWYPKSPCQKTYKNCSDPFSADPVCPSSGRPRRRPDSPA